MIREESLEAMAADLCRVPGVKAVVLGGSRARGTHTEASDVDLGVYYDRGRLDLQGLRCLARTWTGEDVDVVGPGGWGPWVDGGTRRTSSPVSPASTSTQAPSAAT